MVYILETELLTNKSIFFALNKIYGINNAQSNFICKKLGFTTSYKVKELSNDQLFKLVKCIENINIIINNDLKKNRSIIIKNLISIKLNRGIRLNRGLPNRGQRTHTNAKSAKRSKKY